MYTSITWHGSPLNQTFGWLHGLPWRGRDETAHWTDGVLAQVNYQLGGNGISHLGWFSEESGVMVFRAEDSWRGLTANLPLPTQYLCLQDVGLGPH